MNTETELAGPSREYVAIHEAAHAVVGILLGAPLDIVTIVPGGDTGSEGHAISVHGDPLSRVGGESWALMARAISSLAGHMATIKLGHNESFEDAGAYDDYVNVGVLLDSICGGGDTSGLHERAIETAKLIVEMSWSSIEAVADELLEANTMTGDEVGACLALT